VTSSVVVFEAKIQVKSTYMIRSLLKTKQGRKYGNERNFT